MVIAFLIILIIAVIYVSLIMPRLINKADTSGILVDYAHRGLHNESLPENSLGAFQNAVKHRYGIELDIQLSKDKVPMVFHDATLNRVCGIDGKLAEYTCEELQKMHLLGSEYTIPTFKEVLELVDGRIPLLIEFKPGSTELCDIVCPILDEYNGSFCIESFDPFILRRIKAIRPRFARGQLVTNSIKSKSCHNIFLDTALTLLLFNLLSRPDFVAYDNNMKYNFSVFLCKKLFRIPTFVWTIKSDEMYKKCIQNKSCTIFEGFKPE